MKHTQIVGTFGALLGLQAIVASTAVLTGLKVPAYHVLTPLVAYNSLAGLLSVVVGVSIFRRISRRVAAAKLIAALHTAALLCLLGLVLTERPVAWQSLAALSVRGGLWWLIFSILRLGASGSDSAGTQRSRPPTSDSGSASA